MPWYEFFIIGFLCCFLIARLIIVTVSEVKVNKSYRKTLDTINEKLPSIEYSLYQIANKMKD